MSDKALMGFITALNKQKEAERRVLAMAEQNPEAAFTYIQSLPKGWDTGGGRDVDLLRRVRSRVLQLFSKEGACKASMQPQTS